ncbi:MAG: rhodanese-like domain-containing protein [Phycisphaerales bacterium JB039]
MAQGDSRPLRAGLEVSCAEASRLVQTGAPLVDVREASELEQASIDGAVHIPLGQIESRLDEVQELAPDGQPILVLCHHGVRSLRATLALHALGTPQARSVAGGIDRWSIEVDGSVPRYAR